MRISVSIPEDVFAGAQRLARQTKKSRSQVFSDAIREYVAPYAPDEVTDAMNRVCDGLGRAADPFVSSAGRRLVERADC